MNASIKKNLSENIYEDLKQQIMMNYLRPGAMLSETELADRYHVSRTPIRQAIQKLADRDLVSVRDGVGTFVTLISYEKVLHAYEVRREIEKIAIRTSCSRIQECELDDLEEVFLLLKKQLSPGGYGASLENIARTDWRLHDLIVGRSENTYLPQIAEQVNLVLRRFQYSNVSTFVSALDEHLEIISLIRKKDLEGLEKALDRHIRFQPI